MRIGYDRWIWIVTDPTPDSELADVLFETDLNGLQNLMIGMQGTKPSDGSMAIWTDEDEARADAEARLEERDSR